MIGSNESAPFKSKTIGIFHRVRLKRVVTPIEWVRFMITHYHDSVMEEARVKCVRILQAYPDVSKISTADRDYLNQLAKDLRSVSSGDQSHE